ncbi:MAG TPA: hypothetical protein VIN59_03655 [Alphaproteobacteria bacterium]
MTSVLSTALNGLNAASNKAAKAASSIAGVPEEAVPGQEVSTAAPDPQDIVDLKIAESAYKANAAVIRVDNEMSKELLRIVDETV